MWVGQCQSPPGRRWANLLAHLPTFSPINHPLVLIQGGGAFYNLYNEDDMGQQTQVKILLRFNTVVAHDFYYTGAGQRARAVVLPLQHQRQHCWPLLLSP
jgi:hypothetical protein